MATNEPMTDERLAEVRRLTATVLGSTIFADFDEATAWFAILDLRREVDRLRAREQALEAENAAMRPMVEAIIAAQTAVTSAEARWHQVTRTDSYPESEVRQTDRQRLTALRTRDTAIEQARAFVAVHPSESAGGDDER